MKIDKFKMYIKQINAHHENIDFISIDDVHFKIKTDVTNDDTYGAFLSIYLHCYETEIKKFFLNYII